MYQELPKALVLHRPPETLNDGNAAVLAHGAKARPGAVDGAPRQVLALKLVALVRDDVTRSTPAIAHRIVKDVADLSRRGVDRCESTSKDSIKRRNIHHHFLSLVYPSSGVTRRCWSERMVVMCRARQTGRDGGQGSISLPIPVEPLEPPTRC